MMLGKKRVFFCRYCGHKLRFGQAQCGDCYQDAPSYNRLSFWMLGAGVVVLALLVLVGLSG